MLSAYAGVPDDLRSAMRHACLGGGKRIRAALVYGAAEMLGGNVENADSAAAAVELIHAYSLIHDDLPAMDDDDMRRGKPACHIAFGEATAILAGDALQALAFECIADTNNALTDNIRTRMTLCLARASGAAGMVAGQALDMAATGRHIAIAQLKEMHAKKTGALIACALDLGGLCANCGEPESITALSRYGKAIGLAFQITDDILDATADTETLGKNSGSDALMDKSTYVDALGLDGARDATAEYAALAIESIGAFGDNGAFLRDMVRLVTARSH